MPDLDFSRLRELTWAEWIEVDGRVVDRTEAIGYLLDRLEIAQARADRAEAAIREALAVQMFRVGVHAYGDDYERKVRAALRKGFA